MTRKYEYLCFLQTVISIFKYHLFKQFDPMYLRTKENSIMGEYSKTPKEITVKDLCSISYFAFHNYANECNAWFFFSKKIKEYQMPNANSFYSQLIHVTPYSLPLFFKCYPLRASAVSNIHYVAMTNMMFLLLYGIKVHFASCFFWQINCSMEAS